MKQKKRQGVYKQLNLPLFAVESQKPQKARKLTVSPDKRNQSSMAENRFFSTDEALQRLGFSKDKDKDSYEATKQELYRARANNEEFIFELFLVRGVKKANGQYQRNKWEVFEQLTSNDVAA